MRFLKMLSLEEDACCPYRLAEAGFDESAMGSVAPPSYVKTLH